MKKLFSKIKETKAILDTISKDKIAKRASIKSILFAAMLMLMIILPFVLVLVELFKQFSLIIPFTYFLLFLVFVLSMLFPMLYMTLYFELLKNYTQIDELSKIKASDVFLSELFNPLYIFFAFVVTFIIYFIL